jgi:hypothetical protein
MIPPGPNAAFSRAIEGDDTQRWTQVVNAAANSTSAIQRLRNNTLADKFLDELVAINPWFPDLIRMKTEIHIGRHVINCENYLSGTNSDTNAANRAILKDVISAIVGSYRGMMEQTDALALFLAMYKGQAVTTACKNAAKITDGELQLKAVNFKSSKQKQTITLSPQNILIEVEGKGDGDCLVSKGDRTLYGGVSPGKEFVRYDMDFKVSCSTSLYGKGYFQPLKANVDKLNVTFNPPKQIRTTQQQIGR